MVFSEPLSSDFTLPMLGPHSVSSLLCDQSPAAIFKSNVYVFPILWAINKIIESWCPKLLNAHKHVYENKVTFF